MYMIVLRVCTILTASGNLSLLMKWFFDWGTWNVKGCDSNFEVKDMFTFWKIIQKKHLPCIKQYVQGKCWKQ